MQPKCVHIPTITNHSGFIALAASSWGSGKSSRDTALASEISSGVLLLIKTGLPLHKTVMLWPGAMGLKSTSVEARAFTDASGFIWSTKGHTNEAAPAAVNVPVVMYKKFLLVTGLSDKFSSQYLIANIL